LFSMDPDQRKRKEREALDCKRLVQAKWLYFPFSFLCWGEWWLWKMTEILSFLQYWEFRDVIQKNVLFLFFNKKENILCNLVHKISNTIEVYKGKNSPSPLTCPLHFLILFWEESWAHLSLLFLCIYIYIYNLFS
jgi:hypothetical protein